MCLIIAKSAEARISDEILKEAATRNKDGFGIAIATGTEILIEKGLHGVEALTLLAKKYEDKPCLIHFRLATNGNINQYNCHPFRINDDWVMAHNGIFTIAHGPNESDTAAFARWMRETIRPNEFPNSIRLRNLFADVLNSSKLTFMDKFGNFLYVNFDRGTVRDGAWYSNHSGFPSTSYNYSHNIGSSGGTERPPFRGRTTANGGYVGPGSYTGSNNYNNSNGSGNNGNSSSYGNSGNVNLSAPGYCRCSSCGRLEPVEDCVDWGDRNNYCFGCIGVGTLRFRHYCLTAYNSPPVEAKAMDELAHDPDPDGDETNPLVPGVAANGTPSTPQTVMATATPKATNLLAPAPTTQP